MCTIGIVGGGSACVATLVQLIASIKERQLSPVKIFVFEKNREQTIGAGLAYSTTNEAHILNLPTSVMSAYSDKPDHFTRWIKANEEKWRPFFPDVEIETCIYPPRLLFALYLKDVAEELKHDAQINNIDLNFIYNEVVNIEKATSKYKITLSDRREYIANQVFLCTGHLPPSSYQELTGKKGYLHSPWPIETGINNSIASIPRNQDVTILGTRLTAIDAVLTLSSQGHTGKIRMISRNGWLPTVIGNTQAYTKKYLTAEMIDSLTAMSTRKIDLKQIMELFWKEIETAENRKFDDDMREKLLKPGINPRKWLVSQIVAADTQVRPWQAVLTSLYPIVPKLWDALKKEDKITFLRDYYSIWMTYLAAFPVSNARKLLKLISSGKLEIIGGLQEVVYNEENQDFLLLCSNNVNHKTNYLINCTGAGQDYKKSTSIFFQNLLQQGLITPHPLGGIRVDFKTLCALGANKDKQEGLFVIGDATWGNCMATADFSQVVKEAQRSCNTAVRSIRKSSPRFADFPHLVFNENRLNGHRVNGSNDRDNSGSPPRNLPVVSTDDVINQIPVCSVP